MTPAPIRAAPLGRVAWWLRWALLAALLIALTRTLQAVRRHNAEVARELERIDPAPAAGRP